MLACSSDNPTLAEYTLPHYALAVAMNLMPDRPIGEASNQRAIAAAGRGQ